MTIVIGFGNSLRGEDAFGIDVISILQKRNLKNIKLLSAFQLTPELSLELQEAKKLIFIDAAFNIENNYKLACTLDDLKQYSLSHHISIRTILEILKSLYSKTPEYEVYSMLTSNFEKIEKSIEYETAIKKVVDVIVKENP